jgi:hypothetical protein
MSCTSCPITAAIAIFFAQARLGARGCERGVHDFFGGFGGAAALLDEAVHERVVGDGFEARVLELFGEGVHADIEHGLTDTD